ncbi:hypothetical protein R5R35_007769 [Gryllus longicercus]|uniref:Kinetochore protein SPC25 n=1 Tax=Gryllus longicercus TaxID=2509291 RepID=A0AAN9W146_9ORTH
MMKSNREMFINSFEESLETDLEDIRKFTEEREKSKINKEEIMTSWKKRVESKKNDFEELRKELLNCDLELKTKIAEQEAQRREEEEREKRITLLKEEICELTIEKKRLEKDFEEKKEQASKTFKALVAAMAFYKLHMKCYIEYSKSSSTTFSFCFFYDEDKPSKEHDYYVTLDYYDEHWKVLAMKPTISCEKMVASYLEETGDIIGFVSHVHNVYAEMRKKH